MSHNAANKVRKTTYKTLAAVTLVVLAAGCSQQHLLRLKTTAPEDHWVTTDEQWPWTLHVLRYKPRQLSTTRDPVILCHGLSHNNTFWDLAPDISLARYLQAKGFDVWSVSLRGAGQSTKPKMSQLKQLFRLNISVFNPAGLIHRQPALIRHNWTVDDHIHHDVPAVINYVRQHTGHRQVHWIGHSMGAMIMFGYLANYDQTPINTFVAVSGPMYLIRPANDVYEILANQPDFVRIGNLTTGTNLRAVVGTLAGGLVKTPIDLLFLNDTNVEPAVLNLFYYACEEDISPGQLDQLIRFIQTGHFLSYDGKTDYTEQVDKINVPVLQIVGRLDNMAPCGFVAAIQNKLTTKDKQLRIFGKINGHHADYGHDDIIIGKNSRIDVFPHIRKWLAQHPSTQPATQPARKPAKRVLLPLPKFLRPGNK